MNRAQKMEFLLGRCKRLEEIVARQGRVIEQMADFAHWIAALSLKMDAFGVTLTDLEEEVVEQRRLTEQMVTGKGDVVSLGMRILGGWPKEDNFQGSVDEEEGKGSE